MQTVQKLLSSKSSFKHITLCLGFPVHCAALKMIKCLIKTVISSPCFSLY